MSKALTEFGTEPSFPAIKMTDTSQHQNHQIQKATNYIQTKAEEIKKQYNELVDLAKDTEMLSAFEKRFEPMTGRDYWVYESKGSGKFISIIRPEEWTTNTQPDDYHGHFRLSPDGTWIRQNV
jgi:hypothetical protein